MPTQIKITAGEVQLDAELNDTSTAKSIIAALPIKANGNRWGAEIYFEIPVDAGLDQGARDVLEAGELGYWPTGNAFCIFFGPTPASTGDEIRAASDVNIIGKVTSDLAPLFDVPSGAQVTIEAK
ncbi:MAG: cyclophilin-like fold protein [Planctomycetota bacterium]|jgi:hypothetical protein